MREDIRVGLISLIYDSIGYSALIFGIFILITMIGLSKVFLGWNFLKIIISIALICLGIVLSNMSERNWILNYKRR